MGRRKQANPIRVADDCTTQEASTSETTVQKPASTTNGISNGKAVDKKSAINFSISAHLQADANKQNKVRKSSNPNDNSSNNVSHQAALKSYQTLMNNLKQQDALMKSMGFANSFFMNPFFAASMPSFDLFSGLQNTTPKKKHKLEEDAVDLSTKKKRTSENKPVKQNTNGSATSHSALDKLSSLVTTVGNSPSPLNNMMRMQNSVFGNSDANSDPTRVFTCLQCFDRFQSMQELVNHMEKTLHFNQLKAFANSSSSKAKSTTNSPAAKSPSSNDKTRANSRGGTFSFECLICGHSSSGSIDEHMSTHNFSTPTDWINSVKLIPL
ncbi:Zinc finger, C2H2 domain and Zinc finger C2H2-type/integrase DNA-binding domain-containing protein [Aphelenchoides bicaudatus]|nr:Zinc finger, C2H2 domain and Zinc finger C2H2-type/integrase DNA-binding domain-containing protein [Aphelenchoides bicaudatus]